jgi:prevent-host-death family protein
MSEAVSVSARDLSRRAASVLDRVEHGERLTVTRDGEPIAEIVPIDPVRRVMLRWTRTGVVAQPPDEGWATAGAVADAVRSKGSIHASVEGPSATDALFEMRDEER